VKRSTAHFAQAGSQSDTRKPVQVSRHGVCKAMGARGDARRSDQAQRKWPRRVAKLRSVSTVVGRPPPQLLRDRCTACSPSPHEAGDRTQCWRTEHVPSIRRRRTHQVFLSAIDGRPTLISRVRRTGGGRRLSNRKRRLDQPLSLCLKRGDARARSCRLIIGIHAKRLAVGALEARDRSSQRQILVSSQRPVAPRRRSVRRKFQILRFPGSEVIEKMVV
jgi:hypothetical protein